MTAVLAPGNAGQVAAAAHPPLPTTGNRSPLGDARHGKLAANITAFGRALRRAGVTVDSARIVLATQAVQAVGVESRADVCAALETVLVSRAEDRAVFRELFGLFFRDPELGRKLLQQLSPDGPDHANPPPERPRVRQALQPRRPAVPDPPPDPADLDAAMTASQLVRLRHADFNQLTAGEYHLVERLVRDIPLPVPCVPGRRTHPAERGAHLHWGRTLRAAARTGGNVMSLRRRHRDDTLLPLLVLVDVSGSMERYARLLLAFLHAATARAPQAGSGRLRVHRDVFAFGTELTDLTTAFHVTDTDTMLQAAGAAIADYAGGTRLGDCLAALRRQHARRLVGRRTLALIVSDGLDTGEPETLETELQWLKHHTRRILWLNPLLRFSGYAPTARGAAVLHRHADAMLAVHNITRLQQLAGAIATLMKQ